MLTFATNQSERPAIKFVLTPWTNWYCRQSRTFHGSVDRKITRGCVTDDFPQICLPGMRCRLFRPLVGPSGVFWFVFTDGAAAGKTATRFLVHRFTFGCVVQPCPSASAAGPGTHRVKSLRIWQQHLSRLCRQVYSNPEPLESQIY